MTQQGIFSDAQARAIKINLIEGVSMTTLARLNRCSVETIRRMKAGLTYRHVVVVGEEMLRPDIELLPLPENKVPAFLGKTAMQLEIEEEDGLAHLMRVQAEVNAKKAEKAARGDGMVDELIVQQARALGAKV